MGKPMVSKTWIGGSNPSTPAIIRRCELEWILEWPSDVVDFNAIKFRMGVQNGNAAGC